MKKLIALLLAVVMLLTLFGCNATDPAQTTEGKNKGPLFDRDSYTADDASVLAARKQTVATVGTAALTNGTLQIYYWSGVYEFLNNYGYYAPYFGLDYSKALDNQPCAENDGTWQQYFLSDALQTWHNYQAMALMANDAKMTLSEAFRAELDALDQKMSDAAAEGGFESVDAFIQDEMGPGCTYEEYRAYMEVYYMGLQYFTTVMDGYEITDDMISNYFTTHESELKNNGITKDSGDVCSVRHILIEVAAGKTDADWEACRVEAQALLDEWLAGDCTEDTFAAFATEHSADGGSGANGGLYTGLNKDTNFVQEFKNWYLDESRQAGDYGLIKTTYGYHIMYYSGSEPGWVSQCRNLLRSEYSATVISTAAARYPITVAYEKILLGEVSLAVTE